MFGNLTGWHFVAIIVVVLIVFGGAKLPSLAKNLAQSLKIFRSEIKPKPDETPEPTKPKSSK